MTTDDKQDNVVDLSVEEEKDPNTEEGKATEAPQQQPVPAPTDSSTTTAEAVNEAVTATATASDTATESAEVVDLSSETVEEKKGAVDDSGDVAMKDAVVPDTEAEDKNAADTPTEVAPPVASGAETAEDTVTTPETVTVAATTTDKTKEETTDAASTSNDAAANETTGIAETSTAENEAKEAIHGEEKPVTVSRDADAGVNMKVDADAEAIAPTTTSTTTPADAAAPDAAIVEHPPTATETTKDPQEPSTTEEQTVPPTTTTETATATATTTAMDIDSVPPAADSAPVPPADESKQAPVPTPAPEPVPQEPVYRLSDWAVEEESDDDDNDFTSHPPTAPSLQSKKIKKQPTISIAPLTAPSTTTDKDNDATISDSTPKESFSSPAPIQPPTTQSTVGIFRSEILLLDPDEQIESAELALQDSLAFFRQSHEDQDPDFLLYQQTQTKKQIEQELQQLSTQDHMGRKEIDSIVSQQLKEKQQATERSAERFKAKTVAEEQRDMARLQKLYSEKSASNQSKINHGIQELQSRHKQETQRILQRHREQIQQRNVPEQVATQEWQSLHHRLSEKHRQQLQQFAAKGEELKKRTQAEYQRDQAKLRQQYEKRLRDMDTNRQSIHKRMYSGFQLLRQRYLKRHAQKILKTKESLQQMLVQGATPSSPKKSKETAESTRPRSDSTDILKNSKEDNAALRQPVPIYLGEEGLESPREKSGPAVRHKHRKGVLSAISKQLSIEIHNEGIWIEKLTDKKEDDKKKSGSEQIQAKQVFMPWGYQARDFLLAVVCGEIPPALEEQGFDFGDTITQSGGHIRCVLTDLRIDDDTACAQRIASAHEHVQVEIAILEKKVASLHAESQNAEKICARSDKEEKEIAMKTGQAMKEYESRKNTLNEFRKKYHRYLNPDGTPSAQTSASNSQQLIQTTNKIKAAIESAEKRAKAYQASLNEKKVQVQKQNAQWKQMQRNYAVFAAELKSKRTMMAAGTAGEPDHISSKVRDTTATLALTAGKRRDQLNLKRNTSTSSTWVQSLPPIPGQLKKSLWYKMHRRRQQIFLRPTSESLVSDLRKSISKTLSTRDRPALTEAEISVELEKAEQLFLLATFPAVKEDSVPSSVPTSTDWGEPGWHLDLTVEKSETKNLLPRANVAPLLTKNLAEVYSAPGRQAATLLRTAHLRSLAGPLSAVSIVTSLAEANPAQALAFEATETEKDPLRPSAKQLEVGYTFNPKAATTSSSTTTSRRKAPTKESAPASATAARATSESTAMSSSSYAVSTAADSHAKATNSRKRKPSTTEAASRPAQRRKPSGIPQPTAGPSRAMSQMQQQQQQQQAQQKQQQSSYSQHQNYQQHQSQHQPPPQLQAQQQQSRQSYGRQQHTMGGMDSSQGSYNQYMKPMGAGPGNPQQGSYQQQLYQQQQQQQQRQQQYQQQGMPQMRVMQQQQQQQPQQGVPYGQSPHGMQQMPQFFQPMQQNFAQGMPMPGQVVGPPGSMPMNMQNTGRPNQGHPNDEHNDPLFMLKDM